jgi:subtilase family serine protease
MPRYAISVLAAVVVGGLTSASSAFALPHSSANGLSHRPVCAAVPAPFARCDSQLVTTSTGRPFDGKPQATSGPAGYHPSDLQSAYSLSSSPGGSGQTVAIVDAYNDPNAAKDLASYRSAFGLPAVSTCSVSTGKVVSPVGPCFVKVNQSGGTGSFPRNNAGWSQEISLDVDMVSAICPKCNIALVEASSNSMTNLSTAVNEAATLGANEISNSYGGSEFSSESSYDSYFTHPGFAITAGSGDGGYGVEYPAASPDVTAVGGTTLTGSSSTGWSQTAWSGAGSGCSAYEPQPSWQALDNTITAVCGKRAVADVSADADPNTGVSVYDTYSSQGMSGWLVFGGTSVASPIVASVHALRGNASSIDGNFLYDNTGSLNDVKSGSNGSCGGSALCTAGPGWDGPTGLGTPSGTGAF